MTPTAWQLFMARVAEAVRQIDEQDIPADVADRILEDIDAVATDGGICPPVVTEDMHHDGHHGRGF